MLCTHKHNMSLCQDHKIYASITQCALWRRTKHLAYAYNFENELFPTTTVQQRLCSIFWKFMLNASRSVAETMHTLVIPWLRTYTN